MANTTWSSTDKTAGVTLSGSNLIATTAGALQGVRGAHSQTSGKYYWEYTYTTIATNGFDVGLALSTYNLSGGGVAGAAFVIRINGTVNINGTSYASLLGTIATGTTIGVAADFTSRLIWFRVAPTGNWNGSGTADPATATGGLDFSSLIGALFPLFIGGSTDQCTANFGDTAFSGARPSGFTAGFPAAPTSAQATQVAAEQWINANADARMTSIFVEHWGIAGTSQPQAVATLVALEQWMTVGAPVTAQARAIIMA